MSTSTRIIGLAGKAGSGKDTVADYITEHVDFGHQIPGPYTERVMFAEPMKEAVLVIFSSYGITREDVYGPSHLRNKQIGNLTRNDGEPLTLRHVLQTLGTEWGRECCYLGIWVDIALQRVRTSSAEVGIITDCRFDNEFIGIRQAGGELWHLDRPGAGLKGEAGTHPSERDLDGPVLKELRTHHIRNLLGLDSLRERVHNALAQPLQ